MLEVKNLTHSFDSLLVLRDLSFQVEEDVFLAIVGPNGCGKTTLLRLIAGLITPARGEIRLNGGLIRAPGPERGFVFQEYALFPWRDVRRNIEFGLELKGLSRQERGRISEKYIELTGLTGFEGFSPRQLSGGMKQRVSIARALANNPDLILMDEPFAALDCQTRNAMQEELLHIWQEARKTVLFVTHNVEEAVFLADRILVLSARPGRVCETIVVDIPRPRSRIGRELNRIRGHILDLLAAQAPPERWVGEECRPPAPAREGVGDLAGP